MTLNKACDNSTTTVFETKITNAVILEKPWLNREEVAVYLGISARTVYDYVVKGLLKNYSPRTFKMRFKRSDIDTFLENWPLLRKKGI